MLFETATPCVPTPAANGELVTAVNVPVVPIEYTATLPGFVAGFPSTATKRYLPVASMVAWPGCPANVVVPAMAVNVAVIGSKVNPVIVFAPESMT